jgi:1-acyl-sn-glycerol-3-phosphate acyltransferase
MKVAARAAWRLLRGVLHVLHGVSIVLLRFGRLDARSRHVEVQRWSARLLQVMGIAMQVEGRLQEGGVLLAANHISWLDITALHAVAPHARFVSKAAIQSWPLLSRLADAAGTLYLERERKRDALRVVHLVAAALSDDQAVAVFPEGTTSDGHGLLPFHANLLQAAVATSTPIQPVALRFSDATDAISRAVEFVGETTLVTSLWRVACAKALTVHVTLLPPRPSAGADRRVLAHALRDDIAAQIGV